ncbi:hypothetical protein [Ruania alba]|uniref:Polyketide cyclase / dehydrase and lipid transport n=1 Tax=Ruania alba TaxID=648782 RepID=A0A1H5MZ31_9MICO|nr:hypothetical protein [Ruania alba]SEE93987.1 hypothetical protein SAMN04488554_3729 [Ruania alba]
MTSTTASRVFSARASTTFAHLTTLPRHEVLIPFTRITARPAPAQVGDTIVAVTGGLLRDVMLVTEARPPDDDPCAHARCSPSGVITFRKVGPVLLGTARIRVTPLGRNTCRVDWTEEVHLVGPLRLLGPVIAPALHVMTARALRVLDGTIRPSPGS